ncbi:MAG: hypothetical protein H6746_06735 [Deltaproteobacteria bacterium]|nr:hypothetical protein [Deltaproteobacteria bacterium]
MRAVALAAVLVLAVAGCGGGGGGGADAGAETETGAEAETDAETGAEAETEAETGAETGTDAEGDAVVVVTFNTGTAGVPGGTEPGDNFGYGPVQAGWSDTWYGNGLAWTAFVDAAAAFLADVRPDIVAFQEIFYSGRCPEIPAEARVGFVCETWQPGDPTVAQLLVGAGWQVACHPGKPDKCLAVRRAFGHFRGCDADLCLEGLAGSTVPGCGSGARVARGVIERSAGPPLTVVNFHGTSGFDPESLACRVAQVEQVFVDLGDGAPGANGDANIILGDLNTDPGRLASDDPSAARWLDFTGPGSAFHFVTELGEDAPATYGGLLSIDHVLSDTFDGACWSAGTTEGHPPVTEARIFDHQPTVCVLRR